tara:strand:+ start:3652 stop:3762 length:111 start_codon:yes stop_codon:yes gene_type:complete
MEPKKEQGLDMFDIIMIPFVLIAKTISLLTTGKWKA